MKKLVSAIVASAALLSMMSPVQADVSVYNKSCKACHGFGPGPKLGNKADWKDRVTKGMPALVKAAIDGTAKGMPAKGGNPKLTDAQVKSAVQYMVDSVK